MKSKPFESAQVKKARAEEEAKANQALEGMNQQYGKAFTEMQATIKSHWRKVLILSAVAMVSITVNIVQVLTKLGWM